MKQQNLFTMKNKLMVWLLVVCSITTYAQFRVVGYLPSYRANMNIEYGKFTHICLAFANPKDDKGTLTHTFSNIKSIVDKAHAEDAKVLISIGGGGLSSTIEGYYYHLMKSENRSMLIDSLLNFVEKYDLDGIDMDLEGDLVEVSDYDDFVIALSQTLKAKNVNWEYTAALTTWNAKHISDKAIATFDFINSMSYDDCGPTWGKSGCQHSSFSRAEDDYAYWVNTRKIAKDRFVLGVPFYGIDWNTNEYVTYSQVLAKYPNEIDKDEANNGTVIYNGKETIRKKTQYALDNGGGVMIWEIGQDAVGNDNSLLNVITKIAVLNTNEIKEAILFTVFPNPAQTEIVINMNDIHEEASIAIVNVLGNIIYQKEIKGTKKINLDSFEEGIYFIQVLSKTQKQTQKIRVVKG